MLFRSCTSVDNNTRYKVTGLKHSAVTEYTYTAPTPVPSGGGGGGGGPSCTPDWQCTEWSKCSIAGTQTRICTDNKNCRTTAGKPVKSQSCTYVPPKTITKTEEKEEKPTELETLSEEVESAPAEAPPDTGGIVNDTTKGSLGGITGRFFQNLTGTTNKWIVISVLVLLGGGLFYSFVLRKRKPLNSEKS